MKFALKIKKKEIISSKKPTRFLIFKNNNQGQTLVELLVAISILTTGFLGILTLLARSLSLNRVISDNYTATYLAAEGIEIVKNIILNNRIQNVAWNQGLSTGVYEVMYNDDALENDQNRNLLFDTSEHLYGYTRGQPTNFKRKIEIQEVDNNELKVKSIVSWTTRGGGSFSVELEDRFFKWWSPD